MHIAMRPALTGSVLSGVDSGHNCLRQQAVVRNRMWLDIYSLPMSVATLQIRKE
jgi:hypothetical protein